MFVRRRASRASSIRSNTRSFSRAMSASNSARENLRAPRCVTRLVVREGHAPDLRAAVDLQIVEVLGEPGDEVALGDHHVDRQLDPQLAVELVEPAPRRLDVRFAHRVAADEQILRVDGEDDAVDRPARAILAGAARGIRASPTLSDSASESCVV